MALIDIYQDSRGKGRCRSCGADVEWAEVVKSGKRIPFDGEIVTVRTQGGILESRIVETVDTGVTSSHFETCPQAKDWRRR